MAPEVGFLTLILPTLIVEQLVFGDRPKRPGRQTRIDPAVLDVPRQDRSGGHDAVRANLLAGKNDRADTQAATASNRDSLEMLESLFGPAHEVVIARENAGRHENTILDGRIGRQIDVRFEFAVSSNAALVFDGHAASDDRKVTDFDLFSNGGKVRHEHFLSERAAGINDDSGTQQTPVSDSYGWLNLVLCDGAIGRAHWLFANDGLVVNADVISNPRAVVDDAVVPDTAIFTDVDMLTHNAEVAERRISSNFGRRRNDGIYHDNRNAWIYGQSVPRRVGSSAQFASVCLGTGPSPSSA